MDHKSQGSKQVLRHRFAQGPLAFADLLQPIPWKLFATLTMPYSRPQAWWDTTISIWLRELQANERATLGWLIAYEPHPRLHAHLLIAASTPLTCNRAELSWLNIAGTRDSKQAKVEVYDASLGAPHYVSKLYGTVEDDVRLEGPLSLLAGITKLANANSRCRRRLRRIQAQQKRAS